METGKLTELGALAAEYRRQLQRVDRGLQKAKLAVAKSKPRKSPARKLSNSPKPSRKPKRTKKVKAVNTVPTFSSAEGQTRPQLTVPSKKAGKSRKPKPKKETIVDEKARWRDEYKPVIEQHLIETYAPYEATIANLKQQLAALEDHLVRSPQTAAFANSSVNSLQRSSQLVGAPQGSRMHTFGEPVSEDLKEQTSMQRNEHGLHILEARNNQLKAMITQFKAVTDQNQGTEEHSDTLEDEQREIEVLRSEVEALESRIATIEQDSAARVELAREQELVKMLAVDLQAGENERIRLYSALDQLKRSINNSTYPSKPVVNDQRSAKKSETLRKIEELKQTNRDLAIRGRDYEEKVSMLNLIERNLQEYHDEFCYQINDPEKASQGMYNDYLKFLVDGYKQFLQQLLVEESNSLHIYEISKTSTKEPSKSQEANANSSDPYLRLLNKPQ